MTERALLFAKESVEQSRSGPYAGGVAFTSASTLANLYDSLGQHKLTEQYLEIAAEAFAKIPPGFDRARAEMWLDIVKARNAIHQQRYSEAESLLENNITIYRKQPFAATQLLSQSLMLSAQVFSETERREEASSKYNEAIAVIESDDAYLKSEGLRVKFDDERRELYDSAIEFEYGNGSPEVAWTYLQKYRAKLFLEFLAAFNPHIQESRRLDQTAVQQRIPNDTQIIEYALLKDRLLIWLITDKLFTVRSVPVSRTDLETKVQVILQKLRTNDDVEVFLTELERLLIEPVANLLVPDRTLAIIPDRALHGLPFAALRTPGSREYLIEKFPILISPSLTHFLAANPVQPVRDAIVGFASQNGGSAEIKELASLANIYSKASTFTGPAVDKSSFLEEMSKASIFHYAGHSVTDAVDPLRSSILLDGNRSGQNSVTAVDISQRRLVNNAVIILSSCDSSVGNSRDGVGVRGLTSAFLIGGAGSVVGSLWPVEASATADLMIRFHRAFANSDMPVAKALREAQLSFLKSSSGKSHPYYWSGFVVTGNSSALGKGTHAAKSSH